MDLSSSGRCCADVNGPIVTVEGHELGTTQQSRLDSSSPLTYVNRRVVGKTVCVEDSKFRSMDLDALLKDNTKRNVILNI